MRRSRRPPGGAAGSRRTPPRGWPRRGTTASPGPGSRASNTAASPARSADPAHARTPRVNRAIPGQRVHLVPVVVVLVGEQVLAPVVERRLRARGARPRPAVVAGRAEQLGPGPQRPRLAEQPSGAVVGHEQRHRLLDERRRVLRRACLGQVERLLQTVLDGGRRRGEDGQPRREPDGCRGVGRVEPGEPARFGHPRACRRGAAGEQVASALPQLIDGRHGGASYVSSRTRARTFSTTRSTTLRASNRLSISRWAVRARAFLRTVTAQSV